MTYTWRGPEKMLGRVPCALTTLTVTSLIETTSGSREAKGTVTIMDYIEGGGATDPWTAIQEVESTVWKVKRDEDPVFCFTSKSGEPLFTLIDSVNQDIKKFIAEELTFIMSTNMDITRDIVVGLQEYRGQTITYQGSCVCEDIKASVRSNPFQWQELTVGLYPQNCFGCSCGRKWWRYDREEELWAPVGDEAAWQMFLRYNGETTKSVAEHPKSHEIYLLETIRSEGLIPIG